MAEIPLAAKPRAERGSAPSRRIRTEGSVPGIVYGHGVEPTPVAVDARDLRVALSTEAGLNALFDLDVAGKHHLAIARALQRHPVRQSISHVDFQVVSADEIVSAEVPVNVIGEAVLVNRADGSVEHLVQNVHVRAKPADIPTSFEVDISDLEVGDSIRIADLVSAKGVEIEGDPETAVVIAHGPRAAADLGDSASDSAETPAADAPAAS